MATIFNAKYFFDCAVRDYGHEDLRTIKIGEILDEDFPDEVANQITKTIYNMSLEDFEALIYGYEEEDEDDSEMLDMGFNPYMGCYDFDC